MRPLNRIELASEFFFVLGLFEYGGGRIGGGWSEYLLRALRCRYGRWARCSRLQAVLLQRRRQGLVQRRQLLPAFLDHFHRHRRRLWRRFAAAGSEAAQIIFLLHG